jgi:lipid II:glycine glycyltransferase (peptidoglycan interpeptide bridge formation enzyme)
MYQIERMQTEAIRQFSTPNYHNTIFTTYEWVRFLEKNQNAEPVVLALQKNGKTAGYFVGLIIKKFGIKILGSPFEGWLTPDMGFIQIEKLNINAALKCVVKYAFRHLRCMYVQINDKNIAAKDLEPDIHYTLIKTLIIDISRDANEIFSEFTKSTRKDIRRFNRKGAILKEVQFDYAFVDILYDQLLDVFAKQNLRPNYNKSKLYDMVEAMKEHPERVMAIQIYSPENICIASALYLGFNDWCYSLISASYRRYQSYLPNEAIRWYGINYWKDRGMSNLDLVGYRDYKLKFAPQVIECPTICFAKFKILFPLKYLAKSLVNILRKVKGIKKYESIDNQL